jgi:hypothetical protein
MPVMSFLVAIAEAAAVDGVKAGIARRKEAGVRRDVFVDAMQAAVEEVIPTAHLGDGARVWTALSARLRELGGFSGDLVDDQLPLSQALISEIAPPLANAVASVWGAGVWDPLIDDLAASWLDNVQRCVRRRRLSQGDAQVLVELMWNDEMSAKLAAVHAALVPVDERQTVRAVLDFLVDRRVLFAPLDKEHPEHCVLSAIKIREKLTDLLEQLKPDSPTRQLILTIRQAASDFCTNADAYLRAGGNLWIGLPQRVVYIDPDSSANSHVITEFDNSGVPDFESSLRSFRLSAEAAMDDLMQYV